MPDLSDFVAGKCNAGPDVFDADVVVALDHLEGIAARQSVQNYCHGCARSLDDRFAVANLRIDDNAIIHVVLLPGGFYPLASVSNRAACHPKTAAFVN